ncbi:hypothetical protein SALBM311S_12741 [Streptomyces alboniger]
MTTKITTPRARVWANSPVPNIVPVSRLSRTATTANPAPVVVAVTMEMALAMLGPPCMNVPAQVMKIAQVGMWSGLRSRKTVAKATIEALTSWGSLMRPVRTVRTVLMATPTRPAWPAVP